ncbi:hypothetical protein CEXT_178401 [Caerostris extrusa]|uniref:Uncharacterized protein n=1 Tax=Caerostris extrusa TaxID=172846 RepID=A0AAV4QPH3_CAEEX|nr:hypothetical protein CEXT_178401 [Caerostris extrusa]
MQSFLHHSREQIQSDSEVKKEIQTVLSRSLSLPHHQLSVFWQVLSSADSRAIGTEKQLERVPLQREPREKKIKHLQGSLQD